MMEKEHGEMGNGEEMCMKCHHRHGTRALMAVIVVIFVFWCGFQFGEIRASVGGNYGGYGYRMMQGGWGGNGYGAYGGAPAQSGAYGQ